MRRAIKSKYGNESYVAKIMFLLLSPISMSLSTDSCSFDSARPRIGNRKERGTETSNPLENNGSVFSPVL